MKPRVLWVEDNALTDLHHMVAPIYADGQYDLIIAVDVSDGIRKMAQHEFDVVIIDIRLPPGSEKPWKDLYVKRGQSKRTAKLGWCLLYSLLSPRTAWIKLDRIPSWITAGRFWIFTVEPREEIDEIFGVTTIPEANYEQKKTGISETFLLDLLGRILPPEGR